MALAESIATRSGSDRIGRANPLVLSALVLAIAPLWQLRFGVIPDTSWIITMCERVLAGDRLYVDLIETNPPFTLWLYMPAVAAAKWMGASPEIVVHIYCYLLTLAGLVFAAAIVRRGGLAERTGLFVLLPVIVALLVIFPGNAFTEREQIGVALLLPILALMGWRATPGAPNPGWVLPIAAGVCASVIMMVKPYYAVMILTPALWVAWRRRSVWTLFAPEYWAAAVVCCIYLGAVITLYPEFLSVTYPMLRDTYMVFRDPLATAKVYGLIIAPVALVIYRTMTGQRPSPLVIIGLLAAAAACIPLVYQGKMWAYHGYPAISLLLMVLAYCAWLRISTPSDERLSWVGMALFPAAFLVAAQPFIPTEKPPADVIAAVRASVTAPKVALIGEGIQMGHPFTRMVNGTWIGSHCSDWLGAMSLLLAYNDRQAGRTEAANRYDAMFRDYVGRKRAELDRGEPDILLMQKEPDYWREMLLSQPEMAGFMDDYTLLSEGESLSVYRRK